MNKIIDLALEYGFNSAVLTVSEISFDPQLRRYCEMNNCGCLGKNHMCPPLVGSPEQIAARIKNFDEFILLQKVFPLEDSFDFEGMTSAQSGFWTDFIKLTEQVRIYYEDIMALGAGGCRICPRCAAEESLPCRFPDRAIPSLEACCINVSELASAAGLKYINGSNTVTYFGAILVRGNEREGIIR